MAQLQMPSSPLVSVEWLSQNLHHPQVVVLDASLKQPQNNTATFVQQPVQIPSARFFDIEHVFSHKQSHLPHMLPSPEDFTREARNLGIYRNSLIVVYDNRGIYASPRAWWMFKAMGHEQVHVLNGGLPQWLAAGFAAEPATQKEVAKGDFEAKYNPALVSSRAEVAVALTNSNCSVIDARPAVRFYGQAPEPRQGLRLGHMPKAVNIPFNTLIERGLMRTQPELEEIFKRYLSGNRKLIFSCGSGVTACITALGAILAGLSNIAVYDGSWSEWGASAELPVV
ncbi:3-mercaptopyruvate sulfurtransferase [uncultured Pontibacter sp.]|uniref:3-mercaptopyruvate sulfurtransferase n=1 Tax=uncultured Pontibacter sp. TaxID=453356 RepID=UPI0026330E95|nr:3-mercaptopyruvate sulfurtransferase [uncultured Pontibacter sp.]